MKQSNPSRTLMGSVQGIINLIKPCSDACCATIPSRLCQFLLTAVAGPGRVSCSFEPDYHLTSRDSNGGALNYHKYLQLPYNQLFSGIVIMGSLTTDFHL